MESSKIFRFFTQFHLTELTGQKVRDLPEMLAMLKTVPGSVIYHHTHRFLKNNQHLTHEPQNEFAYWVSHVLQEERLGEKLAALDIIQYGSIRGLRERLILTVEDHVQHTRNLRTAPGGERI